MAVLLWGHQPNLNFSCLPGAGECAASGEKGGSGGSSGFICPTGPVAQSEASLSLWTSCKAALNTSHHLFVPCLTLKEKRFSAV